jgi:hypothetical protein
MSGAAGILTAYGRNFKEAGSKTLVLVVSPGEIHYTSAPQAEGNGLRPLVPAPQLTKENPRASVTTTLFEN